MANISNSIAFTNSNEIYSNIFKNKKIKSIEQLQTHIFNNVKNLNLNYNVYTIKPFDTLQKISFLAYGDVRYWWIIAVTNEIGDIFSVVPETEIKIYFPLQQLVNGIVAL